jgi:mRNA-degrading endonuclease RelE of RelBE toxin-antitoxin system
VKTFEIEAISAVDRDLKKIDPEVVKEIETVHFKNIRENPFESYELGYAFKGLRSYHFDHKGTSYRIVYEVFEEDRLVVIVMIAPRESFYEKLKRRV